MLPSLAAVLFAAIGVVMLLVRRKAAHGVSLVFGGRVPAGCVAAAGVAMLVLSLLVLFFGDRWL